MGLFDDVLQGGESLIKNEFVLDYEFLPKILPFREQEQRYLAECIKPLFRERSGRNLLIHGPPGIGKTAATKAVLRDLEEQTDEIQVVYVNCWQQNTSYKVLLSVCNELGYRFTQNKNTTDLMKIVVSICNKSAAVLVFDEVDKIEDFDFLYGLLEDVFKKSIFLITNYKSWLMELDERIKSRLTPEMVEFRKYNPGEIREILKQRIQYAFVEDVWQQEAFDRIAQRAGQVGDVRAGLFLMKNATMEAERKAARQITLDHVEVAVGRMDEFFVKHQEELEDDTKRILDVVQANSGNRIGDIYKRYQENGGKSSYKTFQRKIARLEQNRFISTTKSGGGAGGNTTIVNKRISDF